MNARRLRLRALTPDTFLCLVSIALPFSAYVVTLSPTVLADDPGEFQLVANVLGVAHPTGYPLYTLLGYAFAHLVPIGEPAYRINALSAVLAACTLALGYRLLRMLEVRPVVACLAVLALGFSAAFWNYATVARPYGLNWLLLALVLFQFVRWRRAPTRANLAWLAFSYGLSLTNHSTMLFFAPALAVAVLYAGRRAVLDVKAVAFSGLAFALPMVLYLYVPLRGETLLREMASQSEVLGIPRLVVDGVLTPHYLAGPANVVLGSFYTTTLAASGAFSLPDALSSYLSLLAAQFTWVGVLLALAGLVMLGVRQRALFVVIATGWAIDVLIVSRAMAAYGEGPELFTPTWLLAGVCLAIGAQAVSERVRFGGYVAGLALLVVVGVAVWSNAPSMLARHGDRSDAEFAQRVLGAGLPADSVILGAWAQVTPLHYLQVIEGMRRDVAVIQAPLAAPEGRALMTRALDEGRPLYVLSASNDLVAIPLRTTPTVDHPVGATYGRELTLVGYTLRGWDLELYWRADASPAADYKVFVHLIDARSAQINTPDQPPASEYFPTSQWRTGQTFRDVHLLPALDGVNTAEIGLYDGATGKRLPLSDGATTVSVRLP